MKKILATLGLIATTGALATGCASTGNQSQPTVSTSSTGTATVAHHHHHHKPSMTTSQRNAVESARSYLETASFSKRGLIKQLTSSYGESFPRADARFAVNYLHPNWNAQAVKSARDYLDTGSFSKQGLYEQLTSSYGEGFTPAQARHAVDTIY